MCRGPNFASDLVPSQVVQSLSCSVQSRCLHARRQIHLWLHRPSLRCAARPAIANPGHGLAHLFLPGSQVPLHSTPRKVLPLSALRKCLAVSSPEIWVETLLRCSCISHTPYATVGPHPAKRCRKSLLKVDTVPRLNPPSAIIPIIGHPSPVSTAPSCDRPLCFVDRGVRSCSCSDLRLSGGGFPTFLVAGPEWSSLFRITRGLCHHKNFFFCLRKLWFVQQFPSAARKGDYHCHPPFIIHTSLLFYWPTGAFPSSTNRQPPPLPLPLPLPLLATAATTFKRRSPSQIIQEPRSFPLIQSGCRRLRLLILATLKTRPTGGFLHIHTPRHEF